MIIKKCLYNKFSHEVIVGIIKVANVIYKRKTNKDKNKQPF